MMTKTYSSNGSSAMLSSTCKCASSSPTIFSSLWTSWAKVVAHALTFCTNLATTNGCIIKYDIFSSVRRRPSWSVDIFFMALQLPLHSSSSPTFAFDLTLNRCQHNTVISSGHTCRSLSLLKGVTTRSMVDALSELDSPFLKGGNSAFIAVIEYRSLK